MDRFGFLPLEEGKFRRAPFRMILHFDRLDLCFDFVVERSVGNSTVAIE
jgi:hypothetical protein